MNGKRFKEIAQEFKDDEELVAFIWSKEDADERIQGWEGEDESTLTNEQWLKVAERMENDNYLNHVSYETFAEIVDEVITLTGVRNGDN